MDRLQCITCVSIELEKSDEEIKKIYVEMAVSGTNFSDPLTYEERLSLACVNSKPADIILNGNSYCSHHSGDILKKKKGD